jgi:hypothetical protein
VYGDGAVVRAPDVIEDKQVEPDAAAMLGLRPLSQGG